MRPKSIIAAITLCSVGLAEPSAGPQPITPQVAILQVDDESQGEWYFTLSQRFEQHATPRAAWGTNRFGLLVRSELEDTLVSWREVSVIERARMDVIQRELEINRNRGGDRKSAENILRQYGVTHLVLAQIINLTKASTHFVGYNISNDQTTYTARLRLRVVSVSDEKVVFSARLEGQFVMTQTPFSRETHSDPETEAVLRATRRFAEDRAFRDCFLQRTEQTLVGASTARGGVTVEFDSQPAGAVVELGGFYAGTTPFRLALKEGAEFRVRMTKPGWLPWHSQFLAAPDLKLFPELTPETTTNTP